MPEMYPCPLWNHNRLLRPIAVWSLDTFGGEPPILIGCTLRERNARFIPVPLDPFDPVEAMADLIIPDEWDVLAVVTNTHDAGPRVRDGIVAHCVDRAGRSATELDEWCGRRRSLTTVGGRLHDACLELFSVPGW